MFALLLALVPMALAGRIDRVTEMATAGDHAGVVETVGKWEAAGSLGDEEAALVALRDRSALNMALAAHTTAALRVFQLAYADSALVPEALKAEQSLAFEAAQDEGTSAALRGFLSGYAASPFRAQALTLEDGLAFQEAAAIGTLEAIAEFRRYHPGSPYLATAWEAIAAHTPGITVLLPDGTAYLLPNVLVTDGHVPVERSPALASPRPWVAVNVPGTGRGATSEWWGLLGVGDDGTLLPTSPLGRAIEQHTGVVPPGMLDLVAAPGAHSARVAGMLEPLLAPGVCSGIARFAFVLTSPDGGRSAWTFGVPCDAPPNAPVKGQSALPEAAGPAFLAALAAAEAGDAAGASKAWDRAASLADGGRLLQYFSSLGSDPAADPKEAWVSRRPALGDALVWVAAPPAADGSPVGAGTTTWWHQGPGGPVQLASREGLWMSSGAALWRVLPKPEPFVAAATGGCKAATGERMGIVLVDVGGGPGVDVPFLGSARGGAIAVRSYESGTLTVLEQEVNTGCSKAAAAGAPRAVRVQPSAVPAPDVPSEAAPPAAPAPGSGAAEVHVPAWIGAGAGAASGYSVVTEASVAIFTAFTAPDPSPAAPVVPSPN